MSTTPTLDELRFPIGKYRWPGEVTPEQRREYIGRVAALPDKLKAAIQGLSDEQLDTRYREDGWTLRQVVHHLPDSHINAYCRFRLALTEDNPTIKTYGESRWAELPDAKSAPVTASLNILEGVHARWSALMNAMSDADWKRTFFHPEQQRTQMLEQTAALYAWHSDHHLAHITGLRQRMGW